MTPDALYLNLWPDTVNPSAHWDQLHVLAAIRQAGLTWGEANHVPGSPKVVLISGQHHHGDSAQIMDLLAHVDEAVVILHSDEASLYPWETLNRPGITLWISTPRRSVHAGCPPGTRFFGEGAGPPISLPPVERDLDVAFIGQATHRSRTELVGVLSDMDPERVLCEPTAGFMQGRPRAGYLQQMARAKIAPCPSGAATTCSFRVHEALTLDCVPVVERFTPDGIDHEQWEMVHPDGLPFPVVGSWSELPDLLPYLLHDYDRISRDCQEWWKADQAKYADWLRSDLP